MWLTHFRLDRRATEEVPERARRAAAVDAPDVLERLDGRREREVGPVEVLDQVRELVGLLGRERRSERGGRRARIWRCDGQAERLTGGREGES